tara:strand:+ start:5105 stop:5872 length:768 start_codon:yes stop_codon:yes gene_type:complete
MSKVLPVIEMPKKEPEPPIPDTPISQDVIKEVMEMNDSPREQNEISMDIIDVEERDVPTEEEVFLDPPAPRVKAIKTEYGELIIDDDDEPVKKGKRKYTRKQPMTDKQKDHLARIRKIAQEKRVKEKERKANEKEEAQLKKVEERLLKKKQLEEEKSLEDNPPPSQPRPRYEKEIAYKEKKLDEAYESQSQFTQADLDSAVLKAVTTYDSLRKQQKKEKKQKLQDDAQEEKMRQTIQRAIQPQQQTSDPWRSLFS